MLIFKALRWQYLNVSSHDILFSLNVEILFLNGQHRDYIVLYLRFTLLFIIDTKRNLEHACTINLIVLNIPFS
jgi:hypothetical protein